MKNSANRYLHDNNDQSESVLHYKAANSTADDSILLRAVKGYFHVFRRALTLALPFHRPIVRKVVIHVGFPKAASTSIQVALYEGQERRLTPQGIWFTPPGGALNDAVLYDMLVAEDADGIRSYARSKAQAANSVGADTVIVSAERLFTIDQVQDRMSQLGSAFARVAEEVSFVVVLRDARSFLNSYITQMIYNGSVTLKNYHLAEWMIDQTRLIGQCGFPVNFISLEQTNGGRNIAETLVYVSVGRDVRLELPNANVTPSRPIIYALAEGLVARLHAIHCKEDVNSKYIDELRTMFAKSFDETMHEAKDAADVYSVVHRMDAIVKNDISSYIQQCLEFCPTEKLRFFNELVKGPSPDPRKLEESPVSCDLIFSNGDERTIHERKKSLPGSAG